MDHCLNILNENQIIGTARIIDLGLYHRFCCECYLSNMRIMRLEAVYADRIIPLGVCVPQGHRLCIDTRISVKRLGHGKPEIRVVPDWKKDCIPLESAMPFNQLGRLEDAYLVCSDGSYSICFHSLVDRS